MITFTSGNLLDSGAEALVNTVNTVGVMGKGIALMFKDAFPENYRAYAAACKRDEVRVGRMFVTERQDLVGGPRWIVNFPTKKHWRHPSKIEWIVDGLRDLVAFVRTNQIGSIAIPPLGSGNGGLNWSIVRPMIEEAFASLPNVDVQVFEPVVQYQNVAKRDGKEALTPARALVVELVRRYMVLGLECSLLEIQKLAYFLERKLVDLSSDNPLQLQFKAHIYGPYANRLGHLLNGLDGSYLHSEKRIADSDPLDIVSFDGRTRDKVALYLATEAKPYLPALEATTELIDGFESPLGMELLATVDWLLSRENVPANVEAVRIALGGWLGGGSAAKRKLKLFDDRLLSLAIERLAATNRFADV